MGSNSSKQTNSKQTNSNKQNFYNYNKGRSETSGKTTISLGPGGTTMQGRPPPNNQPPNNQPNQSYK